MVIFDTITLLYFTIISKENQMEMKSLMQVALHEVASKNEKVAVVMKQNLSVFQQDQLKIVWAWDMSSEAKEIASQNMELIQTSLKKAFGSSMQLQELAA